ncbi:MAG: EAL domain-containing protein [Rhodocyclaceae bacterium]|nr:EAL domain-containing protein [Rhodocyclaceae bacterium]
MNLLTHLWPLHSIKGRLMAGVMGVCALLMTLIAVDMVVRQRDFMQQHMSAEGQSLAASLAVNTPSWLISNDLSALGELVNSLKSVPHLALAAVLDENGRVRAASDPTLFNLMLDDEPSQQILVAARALPGRSHQIWHDGMVDTLSPVVSGGQHVGYTRVILDTASLETALRTALYRGILWVLLAIAIGSLITWLLVRGMVWRLEHLSKAADKIAAGNLNLDVSPCDIKGHDEVSRLATDFCLMVKALQADRQARNTAEADLFAEKERALVTLHSIGDAVITTDIDGIVSYLNPVAETMTGWSNEEARGVPLRQVFNIENESTRQPVENPVERAIAGNCVVGLTNHTVLISRDGREINIEDSAAPIRDRAGHIIGVVLVFHDVSDRHQLAVQLSYQASHDALTGLYNRIEFDRRLAAVLSDPQEISRDHALLYLDLDQFKVVNDTCGHAAGDDLLSKLAERIQGRIRDADILARLGGDEFGLLLVNCPLERASRIAESLLEEVRLFRFVWEDKTFTLGVSMGLVPFSGNERNGATLLAAADTACYMAKEEGRNRIRVYEHDDAELLKRHGEMHWVTRITQALENDAFVLYQQDIVPIREGKEDFQSVNAVCEGHPNTHGTTGHCEILIRMVGEEGQIIPPGAFIPAAERFGLMGRLDRWVVKHALDWMTTDADSPFICAINLSGQSISDGAFMKQLIEDIATSGIDPCRLCFEITETTAVAHFGKASEFIRKVRALGCRFALDDFGTGMSSFSYLKNLPVDYLKIDGCFIRDMTKDAVDAATVRAIDDVGHAMGLSVIAEYVENAGICDRLTDMGVDFAQGYFHGRPVPTKKSGNPLLSQTPPLQGEL